MEENPNEVIEVAEDIKKAKSLVQEAREQADRIKAENDRTEALVKRQEAARVQNQLGGSSDAGHKEEEIPEEKKKILRAVEFFEGTQLEKDIKKANE